VWRDTVARSQASWVVDSGGDAVRVGRGGGGQGVRRRQTTGHAESVGALAVALHAYLSGASHYLLLLLLANPVGRPVA